MNSTHNPGRVAGLWYLMICILGPLRLMYIPTKLFVHGNASATVGNIAANEGLFRFAMAADLILSLTLIFLVMALYRLFQGVDRNLAVLVIIFGGVMPALMDMIGVAVDSGALTVIHGSDVFASFNPSQRDALAMLLLRLRDQLNTAAEILWGAWLFPLGALTYRSRFLPRFLGIWLGLGGCAYIALSLTGELFPQYQGKVFLYAQPALLGELAFMLWLVIKGARPQAEDAAAL